MLTPEQLAALDAAARAAVGTELETGCPAEITIAQWAEESGWGAHQPGNNCFGIKAAAGEHSQVLLTTEYIGGQKRSVPQRFVAFDTLQQCFERHAVLLTDAEPYRDAFEQFERDRDVAAFVAHVASKYATAPNYAEAIDAVLAMPEVRAALAAVRCQGQ